MQIMRKEKWVGMWKSTQRKTFSPGSSFVCLFACWGGVGMYWGRQLLSQEATEQEGGKSENWRDPHYQTSLQVKIPQCKQLYEEHSVTHKAVFTSLRSVSRNSALLSCIQCHLLVPVLQQWPLRYKKK